ncbi:MAG: DUF2791 family P-loop domain-containing protein [Thermaerobacter sp.]|nr:DUF2791 family P-loop domain-containing protein [Thermaerobacter sp.]
MSEGGPFVDPAGITAFWHEQYLDSYVAQGGSAVKWLRGREGSGKTALLTELRRSARADGYFVAAVSARAVQIGRFDELYRAILGQLPIEELGGRFAAEAARRAGAGSFRPGVDGDLDSYLRAQGRPDEAVQAELASAFDFLYTDRNIAPPVATALRHIAAGLLRPSLETDVRRETASTWISGGKVSASERRRVGIGLALDRYGAREILRSLLYANRMVRGKGLVVTIDDLDGLLGGEGPVRYTRLRRDDAYEAIRELIDEGASMPGLFVAFAGRREAFTDEKAGLRSYAALAMRVEPEVEADRWNPFDDLQDLDALWREDWPRWRKRLEQAYGVESPEAVDAQLLVSMGPVSPVKLLVDAIHRQGGSAHGQ